MTPLNMLKKWYNCLDLKSSQGFSMDWPFDLVLTYPIQIFMIIWWHINQIFKRFVYELTWWPSFWQYMTYILLMLNIIKLQVMVTECDLHNVDKCMTWWSSFSSPCSINIPKKIKDHFRQRRQSFMIIEWTLDYLNSSKYLRYMLIIKNVTNKFKKVYSYM